MPDEIAREQLAALDRLVQEQFRARDEAIKQLATETDRVRAQQNEWRGALNDLSSTKVDGRSFDIRNSAVDEKIARITEELALTRGSGIGKAQLYAAIGAIAVIVISAAGFILAFNS